MQKHGFAADLSWAQSFLGDISNPPLESTVAPSCNRRSFQIFAKVGEPWVPGHWVDLVLLAILALIAGDLPSTIVLLDMDL